MLMLWINGCRAGDVLIEDDVEAARGGGEVLYLTAFADVVAVAEADDVAGEQEKQVAPHELGVGRVAALPLAGVADEGVDVVER